MNFQQPRRIKPPKLALSLIVVTAFCTFFTLYSPSIQIFQRKSVETEASVDNLQDPIRTTELVEQSDSSLEANLNDSSLPENFSDSSSSEDRKSLEENADDAQQVYNSSLSEDIKSLEEDNVQQYTSPNWPDITVEELFRKDSEKKDSGKKASQKKNSKKKESNNKDSEKENSEKNDYEESRHNNKERGRHAKSRKSRGKRKDKRKQSDEKPPPPPPPPAEAKKATSQEFAALASSVADIEGCDIFSGEWVPNPDAPYYTNMTCKHIQEHQNCMKYGKPDKGYMKWKWKPDNECDLPLFDPHQFLELLRGKTLAFVGDSVARNHMQSLICLLSTAALPEDVSDTEDQNFKRFQFSDYNFTISIFWAPYLVRTEKTDPDDVTKPFKLFLDEFDEYWPSQVESYDYIILSAGQWFFRPTMFYLKNKLVGCLYCQDDNIPHLSSQFSYRRAFRTAFSAINSLKNFKGVTFLRTFATSHFEGGQWDKGGDCVRTKPLNRNESAIEDYSLESYKIQLEELKIAQNGGRRRGLKFRLFDATRPMSLRPDGHPSRYGHSPKQNVSMANDCVHWCLPGPIDTLSDFLQELITREFERTSSQLP